MKLSLIHESDNLPHQNKVWQKEEHQGVPHKKHWYQKYYRKAKPYRWPKTTGPKPLGYKEHILGEDISKQIDRIASKVTCDKFGSCEVATELIARLLLKNNINDFAVVNGEVLLPKPVAMDNGTPKRKWHHLWIKLADGTVIDPTFKQFPDGTERLEPTREQEYSPAEYLKAGGVVKNNRYKQFMR